MNIFVVHKNPTIAAQMLCDKHIIKMYIESAQMLSCVHRYWDGYDTTINGKRIRFHPKYHKQLYNPGFGFGNHPCTVWTRENKANYRWHYQHFVALLDEFNYRYGKYPKTTKLKRILKHYPQNIPDGKLTKPALAMPENCKDENPVRAYRNYYLFAKTFAQWNRGRAMPRWYTQMKEEINVVATA